ncbi:endonuclease 8-like 2 [Alligator sinensis]|uniref:Endonuclease 8-like 2 n=1 Tax=Alligator sinensis TaxID=38654 RepID=A0A3Q0H0N3_ALLSI|nr:endonuclease 8-like 2 [Alligator sinensis]
MPEGPSVRKFQLLTSPFVGHVVAKAGGSSRQISLNELQGLELQDSQAHGKNLFLAFGTAVEAQVLPGGPSRAPVDKEAAVPAEAGSGAHAQEGQAWVASDPQSSAEEQHLQREQEPEHSTPEDQDAAVGSWSWLRFHFGMFGSVRANEFSRANKANKRGDWKDPVPRLVLHFAKGGFLVFYNCRIHWSSSPTAKPTIDILSADFHRGQALEALCRPMPICYTLLDQRYFSGLGNIIKNEILYLAKIHPLSQGSLLAPSDLDALLDHAVQFSTHWLHKKLHGERLHPQIYQKEKCPFGHMVMKGTLGPPHGLQRLTWWCPQCQPRVPAESKGHPPVYTPISSSL